MTHPLARILFAFAVVLVSCAVAFADWDVGDPYVYQQLPDPTGWDVFSEWEWGVADDWTATETLNITDIHFWGSWRGDVEGSTGAILIRILDNDTSGPFAKPGDELWRGVFDNGDLDPNNNYTSREYATGDQGWYDPRGWIDYYKEHDHDKMYQYNLPTLETPFLQEAGHTYWLMISTDYEGCQWGWKTATEVNGSTAVFYDTYSHWGGGWQQLKEPYDWCYPNPQQPLDVAFVLTPEPSTILLLGLGAATLLRKRRK